MIYSMRRYDLKNSRIEVKSLFHNLIKKSTGKYVFPFHRHHDCLEISIIVEGEEMVEYAHGSYKAVKGDIVIKNASVLHQETAENNSMLEEISIGVTGINIEGLPENYLIPEDAVPVIHAGEEALLLTQLLMHTRKLYERGASKFADLIQLNVKNILSIVMLIVDDYGESMDTIGEKSELISDVLDYINKNYRNDISLDDIAKLFYVSPFYLTKQFKKENGYSVNQYIQQRRLGEAERRLVFEDTSIKEIACECGYSNLKYFYSVFKTKTGHTPAEFRKLLQSKW